MTNYHNAYNLHVDKCLLFPRTSLVNCMACCYLLNRKRPDEATNTSVYTHLQQGQMPLLRDTRQTNALMKFALNSYNHTSYCE